MQEMLEVKRDTVKNENIGIQGFKPVLGQHAFIVTQKRRLFEISSRMQDICSQLFRVSLVGEIRTLHLLQHFRNQTTLKVTI